MPQSNCVPLFDEVNSYLSHRNIVIVGSREIKRFVLAWADTETRGWIRYSSATRIWMTGSTAKQSDSSRSYSILSSTPFVHSAWRSRQKHPPVRGTKAQVRCREQVKLEALSGRDTVGRVARSGEPRDPREVRENFDDTLSITFEIKGTASHRLKHRDI